MGEWIEMGGKWVDGWMCSFYSLAGWLAGVWIDEQRDGG